MKESELLGKLLPGHPDIFPIIENLREKYQIPEVRLEDDIDWEAVRQDIESQVQESAIFSDSVMMQLQQLKDVVRKLIFGMLRAFMPAMITTVENLAYKTTADLIFEYLLTGKTRDVPQDWFSKVVQVWSFVRQLIDFYHIDDYLSPVIRLSVNCAF